MPATKSFSHTSDTSATTGDGVVAIVANDMRREITRSAPSAQIFNGRATALIGAFNRIPACFTGPRVPTTRDQVADTLVVR